MSEKLSVWIDKNYPHELKDIIQPRIKELESELEEFKRERSSLNMNYKEVWNDNQKLTEQIQEWKKTANRAVSDNHYNALKLAEAEKIAKWWKTHLPFNNDVFNSYILSFADELERVLNEK